MATSACVERASLSGRLSKLREEVRSLQAQLRHSQRLATVGTMTAMVAHEFNNLLTPMLNYARLAQDGDQAIRDKAVRYTLEGSSRVTAICRALLDLSSGQSQPAQRVEMSALVEQALQAMARDPAKDGITLIRNIPARLKLTTRPVELMQVLLNLLLNARHAAIAKGRGQCIEIAAARRDGKILLRIRDTGVGIPRQNLARIFDPFFTTRGENGRGLGLAICRQIARELGGQITVRSQLGKGSVFTVALPDA